MLPDLDPTLPVHRTPLRVVDMLAVTGLLNPALEAALATPRPLFAGLRVTPGYPSALLGSVGDAIAAGRPTADLFLCEFGPMVLGLEAGLWQPFTGPLGAPVDALDVELTPVAALLQGAALGQAQIISASPGGPVFMARAGTGALPRTAEELLDWARQNPGRFMYSHPGFTAGGRGFVCALPHLLRDADPYEPRTGWARSWAYLEALGEHAGYHPLRTADLLAELREGGCDIVPGTLGFDVGGRATGLVPAEARRFTLEGFAWQPTGSFLCVPRHLPPARLEALGFVAADILSLPSQALMAARGEAWPGPARTGVNFDMLAPHSQEAMVRFLRPGTTALVARHGVSLPLLAAPLRDMMRIWDERIGPRGSLGR